MSHSSLVTRCVAAAVTVTATACGLPDKDGDATWVPGKADGRFDIAEAGPAPMGTRATVRLDGRGQAFRVETFGDAALSIRLRAGDADPYLVLEGPLDAAGDRIVPGAGPVVATDDDSGGDFDAALDVTLPAAGVYRIIALTYFAVGDGVPPEGELGLEVTCTRGCERHALSQRAFVDGLGAPARQAVRTMARERLAALGAGAALVTQLDAILADPQLAGIERFPTVPLAAVAAVRPALGLIDAPAPSPDRVVEGDLMALLGPCTPVRSAPAPIAGAPAGVAYGHFPDLSLSPCQAAHAPALASVLTSLAAENGSSVTYRGETIRTPRALLAAFLASGHTVEVRNERTYANFAALAFGTEDVIWPVWLDTGLDAGGESFVIPMGHSHHAWHIAGPDVDARVMFFLGVDGAAFFGKTHRRPAWTGEIVSEAASDAERVLSTVDVAAAYLRRIRGERTTLAAGRPADGYGYLGVCNDSNAAIELSTRGTITTFPLLRAAELDAAPARGDGLDDVMKRLPHDGDGLADRADAMRRALAMQPGTASSWDARLAAQISGLM